jgi:ADP-ribosylglycohydrolase
MPIRPLPEDHLERVYAGVLGKLIGVYLGRPFENWTHQQIMKELGHIRYYVHERFGEPLVITDDDVSGTFQFVRALEEHGASPELTAENIGRTWLNSVIEHRTVFWWGGRGVSTEHTAWLNLKHGVPAPKSGSIAVNGRTVAEQIGAQIFIDGWALVAPGNPELAARLARAAASVSHDGESVFAAQLWAAMEAEAFVSKDVDHLLDTGLSAIPGDCLIARVIGDVRGWVKEDRDWLRTRQRIEDTYGYDKFHGVCHVVPNHAVMVMTLLYGAHSFDEALHIVNTCGWDTDCNSGNVACLVAIMHGLPSFEGQQDWRGPLADRALISSADGGYSINNAARLALDLTNMGRQLADKEPMQPPKGGAQFHFTLPGSVQGFQVLGETNQVSVQQGSISNEDGESDEEDGTPALTILVNELNAGDPAVEVSTETFTPRDIVRMKTYDLMASPLVYPGQTVRAELSVAGDARGAARIGLRLQVYSGNDELRAVDGPEVTVVTDQYQSQSRFRRQTLEWTIPDDMDSQPIQRLGVVVRGGAGDAPGKSGEAADETSSFAGRIWLKSMQWSGAPHVRLRRPRHSSSSGGRPKGSEFWYRAWVQGVSELHQYMPRALVITQARGEGLVSHGTRDWHDYRVFVPGFIVNLGAPAGVAARVQGLNRYYAVVFADDGHCVRLIKARDEQRIVLASVAFGWQLDAPCDVVVEVEGEAIRARVGVGAGAAPGAGGSNSSVVLSARDPHYRCGGVGLVVTDGSVSADEVHIEPL